MSSALSIVPAIAESQRQTSLDISRVSVLLGRAKTIPGMDLHRIEELAAKLLDRSFNLVVVGEFKRGKSTLINALLGQALLPTGVIPLTSVVTVLQFGTLCDGSVTFDDGHIEPVSLDTLAEFVTERGNPKNARGVREAHVRVPARCLMQSTRLIDTPGIGSLHTHNTDLTYRYLPQADAVIFVASADQPMSRVELDFLIEVRRYAGKILCVLNKMDNLQEDERAESRAFVSAAVTQALGVPVPIYPVSARAALQARETDDSTLLLDSGITSFETALQQFLMDEGDAVWQRSLHRQVARLLSEASLAAKLELRALSSPIEVLDDHIRALADKKRGLLQKARDANAILGAEVRGIVGKEMMPQLELFKAALDQRLSLDLESWSATTKGLGTTAFRSALKARCISEIRRASEVWETETDVTLQTALAQVSDRLAQGIQQDLNEVLRDSAQLFDIAFAPIAPDMQWRRRGEFAIKAWDEPPGLKTLTDALTSVLPRPIGKAIVLREAKPRGAALVDMHIGRLRHALEERISDNSRTFQEDLAQRVDRTLADIEGAIMRAKGLRRQGEAQVRQRQADLGDILAKIGELEDQAREEFEPSFPDQVTERASS